MNRRRTIAILAGLAVVVAAAALAIGSLLTPPDHAEPSDVPAVRTFDGGGWAFDYPSAWQFVEVEMVASFFSTVGYLSTQPIDPEAICQRGPDSVSCIWNNYDLAPGNLVLRISRWGVPMFDDAVRFWLQPEEGVPARVAGMPAIVVNRHPAPDRTEITWQIARPDAFGNWIQLDADIRGPGADPLAGQVAALVASFRFEPPAPQLRAEQAGPIAARALAELKRMEPAAYGCYPPPGQSVEAVVTRLPHELLAGKIAATCETSIEPTPIGLWRLELRIGWQPAGGGPREQRTTVQWLLADGTLSASTSTG